MKMTACRYFNKISPSRHVKYLLFQCFQIKEVSTKNKDLFLMTTASYCFVYLLYIDKD